MILIVLKVDNTSVKDKNKIPEKLHRRSPTAFQMLKFKRERLLLYLQVCQLLLEV
jgi:hypothetical protein